MRAKFNTGKTVITASIHSSMEFNPDFERFVHKSMSRHIQGDWGDVDIADKKENEYALTRPLRLFSSYEEGGSKAEGKGRKIWIITEADRSATTILYPSDY